MVRRFDQYYQVKPRDNLGDPDYWNRRFDDIDRRVSSNEDGLATIGGLTTYIEGLALDRLNLVLAPALDKITLVSEQGFLLAHSNSSVTLDTATTQTFAVYDAAERELFAPSPFVTVVRQANQTDYAFARLVSWDKTSGQLVLQPVQIFGNPGPFTDWVIYVGTALSQAIQRMLADTQAARDAAMSYRDTASGYASATAADKAAIAQMKSDTLAARDVAAASAAAAKIWDPTNYIAKNASGTYQQQITFTMGPLVPTALAGDNSGAAASTAFVKGAIDALVNGAPGTLDTLKEIANQLSNDESAAAALTTTVAGKLQKNQNLGDLTDASAARTNLGLVGATPAGRAGASVSAGTAITYMRSDASIPIDFTISPTWTGKHIFQFSSGQSYCFNYATWGGLGVYAPDQGSAFITFHRGAYAMQMGLDGDNYFRWGGWSDGATQRMYISPGGLVYSAGYGASTTPVGGQLRAAGDIIYGISDIRLKDDIQVIEDPLEKIDQIRGVTWIQSEFAKKIGAPGQRRRKAGLLAQELRKVLPEAVGIAPFDSDENDESISGENYLNIQYEQVIGLLVEAIKALKVKVQKLESA